MPLNLSPLLCSLLPFFIVQTLWASGEEDPQRSSKCVNELKAESEFLNSVKDLPAENLSSNFVNYRPQNESQVRAFESTRKFAEYNQERSIGLFLSGNPGIGKTHLAIAASRELSKKKLRILYLTPETMFDFTRTSKWHSPEQGLKFNVISVEEGLKNIDVVVIDDLNPNDSGNFVSYGPRFSEIVMWAHRLPRKRILVTSNGSLLNVVRTLAKSSNSDLSRLKDRVRSLFVELKVKGSSSRSSADWTNEND